MLVFLSNASFAVRLSSCNLNDLRHLDILAVPCLRRAESAADRDSPATPTMLVEQGPGESWYVLFGSASPMASCGRPPRL